MPGDEMPELARAVYDSMRLLWAMRLAECEDRPMPYATSLAVRLGLCRHKMQASRALHWLAQNSYVWSPGSLPKLGQPYGTRLFVPGGNPGADADPETVRVKARVSVAAVAVEPLPEVTDLPVVSRAVVAGDGVPASDASLDSAHVAAHENESSSDITC
jgi:hypothetical protein